MMLIIRTDWCKRCGICVAFCRRNVLGLRELEGIVLERPQECNGCRLCEEYCPDYAIEVIQ